MKKFLLILCALLGTVGAWAGTYTVTYSTSTGSYTATNPAGTWASAWKSTATNPYVTLSTSANNIQVSSGNIYSGNNGCTYTLTAQAGYLITGYAITGTANAAAQTLTPAAGGSATEFATSGTTTLTVSGISLAKTSFDQSTPNNGIAITSFTITLEDDPAYVAPTLSASELSNSKVYTIQTTRGFMTLNTAQTTIVSSHSNSGATVNSDAATDDASRQFAILNIDGKYFIYSPKLNKFACFQGWNLVFHADRGMPLEITNDGSGNPDGSKLRFFAYKFGTNGGSKFCLNNNNSGQLVLNNYTTAEAGNTVTITEVPGASFNLSDAMEVFNAAPSDIYDQHKVYNITNKRITKWSANSSNDGLIGTSVYSESTEAQQQFAFIKYEGKPCLYNVGAQKFLAADGSLTANKGDAATINTWYANDDTYPFVFFIEERGTLFNNQTSGTVSIGGWNGSQDEGNKQGLVEVASLDVYDEMLAFFEIPSWDVTYNIYFNGEKIGEEVRNQDKDSQAALSSLWNNNFVTFTYEPTTITTGVTSVDVTVNWTGPTLYSNYDAIVWKNLYVDRGENGYYYLATGDANKHYFKDPTDKQRASDAYQWGFVGNPYQLKVYNKLAGPTQTLHSDATIGMADGDSYWSIKINYSNGFMIGKTGNTNSFINQAGGYTGTKMGYWSSTQDVGSVFHLADVPEVPVTNVFFDITFNGAVAHTVVASGVEIGEDVPEMPTVTPPAYTTVTPPDVAGSKVTENMHIQVPATWTGPFEISKDFEHAHWYDMAIRETWYVTSDSKDESGALKTVNANALGLGEDAYHWAFIGDPWHIQVYNKAEGSTKNFGYPTQANQGVPSFETDTYYWTIKSSTSGITNSFVMNVGGTDLYINQYGGAGGSLKFWESSNNIGDGGSAFTVFDVPDDYATYVASEISPSLESTSKYFVLKPAVAATVGYDATYKTSCTFEQYKAMKLALNEINMDDLDNFVLPETGYYLLKNKFYGTYMGIDPADKNLYGNYDAPANQPKHIVKLTKTGAATYTISLEGVYAPATVTKSDQVTANETAGTYTVSVPTVGYAAFQANTGEQYSALHCAGGGSIVGWETGADASQWAIEDAASTPINVEITSAGYATLYVPFAVTIPSGVEAYAVSSLSGNLLTLAEIETTIPAETPVILKGAANTYTFTITTGGSYDGDNILTGTYIDYTTVDNDCVLQNHNDTGVGFYRVDTKEATPKVPANRAYLPASVSAGVKAFFFDQADAIKSVFSGIAEGKIFDLSGRKVAKMQKGKTYIVNGKKVNVK